MVAAESASVTAKPSMILARNRRVGRLIERDRLSPDMPTLVFILKTTRYSAAPAARTRRANLRQKRIRLRKHTELSHNDELRPRRQVERHSTGGRPRHHFLRRDQNPVASSGGSASNWNNYNIRGG